MADTYVLATKRHASQFVSLLPRDFDAGAYDDILEVVRREGRFDAIGTDLIPARHDNSIYNHSGTTVTPRRNEHAARSQNEWEAERADRQRHKEAIAEFEWDREEERRKAELARLRAFALLEKIRILEENGL